MTGAEIAIGLSIGSEILDLAILALSEFAISMGFAYILKDSGFTVTPLEEKPNDNSKMIEDIPKNRSPTYQEYKNNPYYFDYTLSSNTIIYGNENLGDIHFFSDKAREILETSGFIVTKKVFNVPEPKIFPTYNDMPQVSPHAIALPNPNVFTQPIFIPADKNIQITFAKKPGKIPERIKKDENHIDISDKVFNKNKKHKKGREEKGGWYIEKDDTEHGGSKWKLKDPDGNVIASLGEDGKILRYEKK